MSRNFIPDESLIDQLSLDDTTAFEELYRRYWFSLYSYAHEKLESPSDAKAVVRDIFISLWENRKTYPISFTLPLHLYTEIRKAVVRCINEKLETKNDLDIVEQKIIPGFAVMNLQKARKPVGNFKKQGKKGYPVKEPWWNHAPGGITMKDIRNYFEKALNLL